MCPLHLTHPSGSVPCPRVSPQLWTLPARVGIRTHNLGLPWVSSPTLYPLGHDCPDTLNVFVVAEGEDIWVPMAKRLLILPDGSAHSGGLHRHRLVQLRYRAIGLFLTHCMNQWPCSFTAWLNKASVRRKKGFSRSDFRQDVVRSGVSTGNLNLFSLKDCFKIEISSNVRPSCG